MFSSLNSPELVVANFIATLLLASIFYYFHPKKYDTMLVFIVGNMIGLIVRFFIDLEIGIGTGFGLFAIFSIMHFRESYNTYTMVYLFLSLSLGILSSLMSGSEMPLFIILATAILLLVAVGESVLTSVKKVVYHIKVAELGGLIDRVKREIGPVKVRDMNVQNVSGDKAKVIVTYKK